MGAFDGLRGDMWLGAYRLRDWMPFVLLGGAAVAGVEASVRGRWKGIIASLTLVGLAGGASFISKAGLLPRPQLGGYAYAFNTFPSGHTAVCLAAVVAVVWLAPRWLHPGVIVVLGMLAASTAFASLLSFAHRGSDIIGGVLLVGALAFAISAVAGGDAEGREDHRRPWSIAGATAVVIGTAVLFVGGDTSADAVGYAVLLMTGGTTSLVLANQAPLRSMPRG
nr:phosphatase PAP2 family protein [Microbacterium bovistercoris]